jgi:hypothetical protein
MATLGPMLQALADGLRQDKRSRTAGYLDGVSGASFDIRVLRGERAIDGFSYANGFSAGRRDRAKANGGVHVAA